jgi:hypothetical protein
MIDPILYLLLSNLSGSSRKEAGRSTEHRASFLQNSFEEFVKIQNSYWGNVFAPTTPDRVVLLRSSCAIEISLANARLNPRLRSAI